MDIIAITLQFFRPSCITAHNTIVAAGCAALFVILFICFSTAGFLGYIIYMFLTGEKAGSGAGMRSMIIILIIPVGAGFIDFAYCIVLFLKNIKL